MKKMVKERWFAICSIMISIFLIGALMPGPSRAQAALEKVSFAYIPVMTYAPIFLGIEKGYFKDQGMELELTRFTSAAKQMGLMSSGAIEIGSGEPAAGLYNALASGVNIKIVADKGLMPLKAGTGTSVLVVRKDLVDVIKSPADLKGKKILLMSEDSTHRVFMSMLYQKYNMTEKDIEYIYISFPQMPAALEKKTADAAYIVEPFGMQAIGAGAREIARAGDIAPGHHVAAIFYSGIFVKNRPEMAKKWMVGYIKGLRYFNKNKKSEEVVDVMNKYTKLPKDIIMKIDSPDFKEDGGIDIDKIEVLQDWFYKAGLVKQKVKVADFVDMSFVDYANKLLGPIN